MLREIGADGSRLPEKELEALVEVAVVAATAVRQQLPLASESDQYVALTDEAVGRLRSTRLKGLPSGKTMERRNRCAPRGASAAARPPDTGQSGQRRPMRLPATMRLPSFALPWTTRDARSNTGFWR